MAEKGERLRFSISDDIYLLREVLCQNPFQNKNKWAEIVKGINEVSGKPFSMRAVKDRVGGMIRQYQVNDRKNLRKSGTEEQYLEKEHLLQEISDLAKEFQYTSASTKIQESERDKGAAAIQNAISAVECILSTDETVTNQSWSSKDTDTHEEIHIPEITACTPNTCSKSYHSLCKGGLAYLREKSRREFELEEKKVRLEEDKLNFEKKKFDLEMLEKNQRLEMEMEERRARLTLEVEERRSRIEIEKAQSTMLAVMFKYFSEKK